jgi:hypothetical protein
LAQSPYKSHAVIVLPAGRYGKVGRQDQRKWLSRGRIRSTEVAEELLARVLCEIGHSVPATGLAALRFWGQTGERSGAWIAAADPVHLEARIDHLCLYALRGFDISRRELRDLFDYLQKTLGEDERFVFARLGHLGYVHGQESMATAAVSPDVVDGCVPDEFMPAGEIAATHDQLLSELQMALHDHEVNQRRAASGRRSVNSLWFWGGGTAPEKDARPIPPLFADDPLFRGYWDSCAGAIESWNESLDEALSIAPDGFVAIVPHETRLTQPEAMATCLENLRVILKRGDLRQLTLLFRDGLKIELEKRDALRFWRKVSPLLMEAADND